MDFETFVQELHIACEAAQKKNGGLASWHEGYAVALEEVDELWQEIKEDATYERKAEEVLQIAATCYAMLRDLD